MRLSLIALAIAAPTSATSANDMVAVTWQHGWFAFPKGFAGLQARTTVKSLREAEAVGEVTKKPWPTVVYIHGCKGHGGSTKIAMRVLSDAGFVVVAPNSFARPGRPETCNPRQHRRTRGAPIADVRRMRLEEIAFAAVAAPKLRWVEKRSLFLYGHSQGGQVVAAYSGEGFKAVVTSGSRCPMGVGAPAEKPGLYMNAVRDPWFHGRPPPGKCWTASPAGSVHQQPVFNTSQHQVLRFPQAAKRLVSFLRSNVN